MLPPLLINMEQTEDIVFMRPTACQHQSASSLLLLVDHIHNLPLADMKPLPQQRDWARWINRCGTLLIFEFMQNTCTFFHYILAHVSIDFHASNPFNSII